jgi:flavin reductase
MVRIGLSSADRGAFLRAMCRVANSVVVVTTDDTAGYNGATVSAFSSVSADPPMVLVCLSSGNRIAEAIAANGTLCVTVLPHDRSNLANRFAGRDDHVKGDRFQGVNLMDAAGAVPEIGGAMVFAGVVDQAVPAGCHSNFIRRVQSVFQGLAAPLAYFVGGYHNVVLQVTFRQNTATA